MQNTLKAAFVLCASLSFMHAQRGLTQTVNTSKEQRFFEAVKQNHKDEVEDSVKHQNANIKDERGNTPLMYAAINGNEDIAKILLDASADVHAHSADGTTPLGAAALSGDENTVELLLKAGADPNETDSAGYSPLMFAAMKGKHAIMKDLIKAGADVSHQAHDGKSALMLASTSEDRMSVIKLLDANADINAQDFFGNTALMYAVHYHDVYSVATLFDWYPRINMTNRKGQTALMDAAITKQPVIMLMLLARESATLGKDSSGRSLADFVKAANDPWVTMAASVLDTTLFRTAGGMRRPGTMPNQRGGNSSVFNQNRYPQDAGVSPTLPPSNTRGSEMVDLLMNNKFVKSYDYTHPHMQTHIDYVNTVYHPASPTAAADQTSVSGNK